MGWSIIWLTVIIFSLIIELVTLDFIAIFFGLGAFLAYIFTLLKVNYDIQIFIFIITSLLSILGFRKFLLQYVHFKRKDKLVKTIKNKKGIAVNSFVNGKGSIRINGLRWNAISIEEICFGDKVIVIDNDDLTLLVKKNEE